MHATDGIRRIAAAQESTLSWPLAKVALASLGVALAIGLFLMIRRLTGGLSAPLPAPQLAITVAILLAWALSVRSLVGRKIGPILTGLAPLCTLLLFAIACSDRPLRAMDWLLWVPAIVALLFAGRLEQLARWSRERLTLPFAKRSLRSIESYANEEQIVQQFNRYRTAAGQDVVRGTLAAMFVPGERSVVLHVAFCPPFESFPHVEAEVAEDASAAAKLTQVLHNGIQLEVRLAKPARVAISLTVEFFAAEPIDPA